MRPSGTGTQQSMAEAEHVTKGAGPLSSDYDTGETASDDAIWDAPDEDDDHHAHQVVRLTIGGDPEVHGAVDANTIGLEVDDRERAAADAQVDALSTQDVEQ